MGFFGSTSYQQIGGQGTNDMVNGLNQFDPWQYRQGIGRAGKGYAQDIKDFYGNKDVSDIKGLQPILSAIRSSAAGNNQLLQRSLTSGDAAIGGDAEGQAARLAQLQRQSNQDVQRQMSEATAGYKQTAMGGYQDARNAQMQQALQAGALGLQGKQGALQGYLESFKPIQKQGFGNFLGGILGAGAGGFGSGFGSRIGGGI